MVLDGLTFNSCGKDAVRYGPVPDQLTVYGMSIYSGEDIMIVNCSFEDSVGTALGVFYSNLHLHGNSFKTNAMDTLVGVMRDGEQEFSQITIHCLI